MHLPGVRPSVRLSVRLSVPSWVTLANVAAVGLTGGRYRAKAAGAQQHGAQQQMRAVSC